MPTKTIVGEGDMVINCEFYTVGTSLLRQMTKFEWAPLVEVKPGGVFVGNLLVGTGVYVNDQIGAKDGASTN